MAKKCVICGKQVTTGNKVSHANNRTRKKIYPNLQRVRIVLNGRKIKTYVCVRCLKAGKVKKVM
ncbi:MAG: 50S ribosomal protein L28 [Candidatus Goldbacteria bacterium]|nr:50S ribosomal protein L28 [Candidatus Goldiibacteriota bacterium]